MKKIFCFLLLTGVLALSSCKSQPVLTGHSGSMGQSVAPVERSIRLSPRQLSAALEGRLGMTEQLPDKQGKKEIPVQWENPSSENQLNGVMFLPGDKLGLNQIEWVESKTKFKTSMEVKEDALSGQIILSDDGKPVLRYNYKTVYEKDALDTLPANHYIVTKNDTFMANPSIYAVPRSNYIHPLYGPEGELLTRDWSKDHPHHRGIYWAWPEVDFGTKRGDLHALQIVFAHPTGKIKLQNGPVFAQIEAENLWMWENHEPIVRETAIIRAYRSTVEGRIIDLAFRFIAVRDSVSIARRETNHYGGLNIRMQTPKQQTISFTTDSSSIVPLRCWSDLSGLFAGAGTKSGLMVFQHQQNPDYPGDWVQYPELSWIQPTFPASGTRYKLKRDKSLILRFRLFVHAGTCPDKELAKLLWDTFNSEVSPLPAFSFPEIEPEKL